MYIKSAKAFGYCTGVEWSLQGWKYEIAIGNDNITVWGNELIGTGNLQPVIKEKPVFRLGELVEFRLSLDGPPIRIVQGIQLINDVWFYSVEWMSPSISEKGVASGVSEAVASLRASEKMGQASYPTDPPSTQTSIPKKPAPFSKPFPRDKVFTSKDSIARVSDYDLERVRL
ncbi:Protein of unknown function DUF1392 (plasmid) [Nostoc flagelliforme CCNUN1]|uniref:Uncharacterized protein n=1 Tax=Nostoc flagelliforme CCNUN1 TaxID=2038116 RepID=A0A2K8T748_9NOSO|nr:Protein of unknown function DUF1392 [Nostoc flagelliforme CCNUN1]